MQNMVNKWFLWPWAFIMVFLSSCLSQAAKAELPDVNNDRSQESQSSNFRVNQTHNDDSVRIVAWLNEGSKIKAGTDTILFFAKKFIGFPYVAFTLDQDLEESLVINTKGVDCTTYVENVMALVLCTKNHLTSFKDFCHVLKHVRYVNGEVGYTTRQHYFTYWISDNINEELVKDVQLPPSPMTKTRMPNVNYMTKHVESYKMLNAHKQWLPDIEKMEKAVNETMFTYIPKNQLKDSNRFRKYIKNGDIIGIVTNKKGLDISHVGFAVWHDDGLHLLNASSLHKKVVDEPMTLYQYLMKQTSSEGIRVVRIL